MTITPDQAKTLLDGATDGPWKIEEYDGWPEDGGGAFLDVDLENDYNLGLAAAAPDLARTVIDQAEQIEKLKRMLDRTDAELHEYRNEFGDL